MRKPDDELMFVHSTHERDGLVFRCFVIGNGIQSKDFDAIFFGQMAKQEVLHGALVVYSTWQHVILSSVVLCIIDNMANLVSISIVHEIWY